MRTLVFSKEMHAQNHFERDVWDEIAFFAPRKGCPKGYNQKGADLVPLPKCRRELDFEENIQLIFDSFMNDEIYEHCMKPKMLIELLANK